MEVPVEWLQGMGAFVAGATELLGDAAQTQARLQKQAEELTAPVGKVVDKLIKAGLLNTGARAKACDTLRNPQALLATLDKMADLLLEAPPPAMGAPERQGKTAEQGGPELKESDRAYARGLGFQV